MQYTIYKPALGKNVLSKNTMPKIFRLFLFETQTGDEKDDKNSLQRFGVLHLLTSQLTSQLRILLTTSLCRRCNTPKRWRLWLSSFSSFSSPVRVSNKNISWNMRVRSKKSLAKLNPLKSSRTWRLEIRNLTFLNAWAFVKPNLTRSSTSRIVYVYIKPIARGFIGL